MRGVPRHEHGNVLWRDPQTAQCADDKLQGAAGVGVIVDHDHAPATACQLPQQATLSVREVVLRAHREPRDVGPADGGKECCGQGCKVRAGSA